MLCTKDLFVGRSFVGGGYVVLGVFLEVMLMTKVMLSWPYYSMCFPGVSVASLRHAAGTKSTPCIGISY